MKAVKWIRNGAGVGYAYFSGDNAELSDAEAIRLRDKGMVLIIPDTIEAFESHTTHMITNPNQQQHNHFKQKVVCR